MLIIENDKNFAKILLDMGREKGFKGLVALDGDAGYSWRTPSIPTPSRSTSTCPAPMGGPCSIDSSIIPNTRHIPVHIITGIRERQHGLKAGAIAYLEKPVSKEALEDSFNKIGQFIDQQVKRLLVVEDDDTQRQSMIELIAHEDVEITAVATADEALEKLRTMRFDCMVLDLGLSGATDGFQLLERVKSDPAMQELPIIIYTGKELSPQEETSLRSSPRRSS